MSVSQVIRNRRSVFPSSYQEGGQIDRSDIEEMLENANWAPNHKHTEPWRFRVFFGQESLGRLAQFLQQQYDIHTPSEQFSPFKHKKIGKKVLQSACVLGIFLHRDAEGRVPEWEELAALSCAVQNIWLTAAEKGIGAYWSTPGYVQTYHTFFELSPADQFRGLFFMGQPAGEWPEGQREPMEDKVKWL